MDNKKVKEVQDKVLSKAMLVGSMAVLAAGIGCAKLYNKAAELRKKNKEKIDE